jgi:hypothetical protein
MTTPDLLTAAEREVLAVLGDVARQLRAVAGGPGSADWLEAVPHLHALEQMVMGQAAARAYPQLYRLLGETSEPRGRRNWSPPRVPVTRISCLCCGTPVAVGYEMDHTARMHR